MLIFDEVQEVPRAGSTDLKAFKLFMSDVGLLSCLANLNVETLLMGNNIFTEFKGALTEQYVLQQLKTFTNMSINYWTNTTGLAELYFIVQIGNEIVPIEVKAEINLQAKSLKTYMEKFNPNIAVRFSMADYKESNNLLDISLYAVEWLLNIVQNKR